MEPKTEIIRKIKEIEGMDWHTVDGKKVRCHITYVTSDYTFFKDFEFNREKGESHVVELQISLRKRNLMCVRPVVVNEKHPVLDGQHLLEACKRERFEVPYTILVGGKANDMILLNACQKNWAPRDYAQFHSDKG